MRIPNALLQSPRKRCANTRATSQNKLHSLQYANLTALESDFKRMVQNAKDFNDKNSLIFADAERVRKGASNWFTKHNPAYNDKSYVAKPTPLPGEGGAVSASASANIGTPTPISLKITNKSAAPAVRTPAPSATPAPVVDDGEEDAEGEEDEVGAVGMGDFKGKSFQKAQEQLINELIEYQECVFLFPSTSRRGIKLTNTELQPRGRTRDLHTLPLPATPHTNRLLRSNPQTRLPQSDPKANRRQSRARTTHRHKRLSILGPPRRRTQLHMAELQGV